VALWIGTLRDDPASAAAVAAACSRVAVLLVGYFAVLTLGSGAKELNVSPDPLVNLPARYDAGWYSSIAMDGYRFDGRFDKQQNFAFFPAYPLMMRAAGHLIGAFERGVVRQRRMTRALWGGVALSLVAFVWAVSYFARLARDTIGESLAGNAIATLAAYPFAVFFSAPYTESVFLLGSVAAFYHFRRHEWVVAAAWGLLVGLTRPNGCLLSVVLACIMGEQLWRDRHAIDRLRAYPVARALLAAAAPGVGMLLYSAFVYRLTGAWFGWARLQAAWGRSFRGLEPVQNGVEWVAESGLLPVVAAFPVDTLNAIAFVFALSMVWPAYRRVGIAAAVFILINIMPPMISGGVLSMGRMTSTLFPMFLALAAILPARLVTPTVTAFALGQGLVATLFFTWRPLY
jgi:hypothetical protein